MPHHLLRVLAGPEELLLTVDEDLAQIETSLAELPRLSDQVVGQTVVGTETEEAESDFVVGGLVVVGAEEQLRTRSSNAALGAIGKLEDVLGRDAGTPEGEEEEEIEDHVDHGTSG